MSSQPAIHRPGVNRPTMPLPTLVRAPRDTQLFRGWGITL